MRWIDPQGAIAHEERLEPRGKSRVESRLDTAGATPGQWQVEVRAGDSRLEQHRFVVGAGEPGA